jgi:hypothetical protein
MKKIYQIFSLTFLFIFLCLPMMKHLYVGDEIKSKENRNLTQRPSQPKNLASLSSYTSKVDDYLADQFGFRDVFIKTANRLRYQLFNETTSKQITMGENGFIFLNSHSAKHPYSLINNVCDIKPLSKELQDDAIKAFSKFIANYEDQGFQTGIAIIPSKSRIYPENLLNPQAEICQNNVITWLDQRINEVTGRGIYYPLKKFRQWKNEFQVYLPSFFHWNGELPYHVADDMMKNYWHIEPEFEVHPTDTSVKTDLQRFLFGLKIKNLSKKYDYSSYKVKACRGAHCFKNLSHVYERIIGFRFFKDSTAHNKLLILSDSFGAKITPHFIRGFDEVAMIELNHLKKKERLSFFNTVLSTEKPTHLLLLFHDGGSKGQSKLLQEVLSKVN